MVAMRYAAALLVLQGALAGCASIKGYPDQPAGLATTLKSLDPATLNDLIAEYNKAGTAASRKQEIRNQIIDSAVTQVDQTYYAFRTDLNLERNLTSVGADWIVLVLAGIGATTAHAATAAALAAASGGIIAAKGALDKDILYQKTILALTTQMDADRGMVFARILNNMKLDTVQYPLEAASRDLQDYYEAGTLVAAIEGLTQDAGQKAQDATQQVQAAMTGTYNFDDSSKKIDNFWRPGSKVNPDHAAKIAACLKQLNINENVWFLVNAGKPEDRARMAACLGL